MVETEPVLAVSGVERLPTSEVEPPEMAGVEIKKPGRLWAWASKFCLTSPLTNNTKIDPGVVNT